MTSLQGFDCYRNMQAPVFSEIIGSFQGGEGTACRGDNVSDMSETYYQSVSADSMENCQSKCENEAECKGVNFAPPSLCFLWARAIQATVPASSETCLAFVP